MSKFEQILLAFLVGGLAGIILSAILIFSTTITSIESEKLIEPEIKLEINNNKVDTIYVYRLK